jgi:hypothetical protein
MIELRAYTLENVYSALLVELPHSERRELRERAEGMIAIADQAGAPIEELIQWIHTEAPTKEWSLAEWRAYCRQRPPAQTALFEPAAGDHAAAFDPK